MTCAVGMFRSWPRAMALVLIAVGAAGCSSDTTRFNDGSYRASSGEVTGSVGNNQAAPVGKVETRPLPQQSAGTQTSQAAPPAPHPHPVASNVTGGGGSAGGGSGIASYNPGAPAYAPLPAAETYRTQSAPEITGAVASPPPSVVRKRAGHWTWDGGTAITVAPGETVEGIAHRHGVPASAIIEANGLGAGNVLRSGQRLVIPRYVTGGSAVASLTPPAEAAAHASPPAKAEPPAAAGPINSGVHVVAPGETLTKIAHQYGKTPADVAKANNIPPYAKVNVGDRIVIPGIRTGSIKPTLEQPLVAARPAPAMKDAANENVAMVTPTKDLGVAAVKADPTPGFRWPVRGRIIAAFGAKPNGQQNNGIDIAVPENTVVKAAEDGEVAYAGNELKGYGNLVLIKHPNGYVTAYAHAKELLVKRGDQIKRGQAIAKSGQSGSADTPELHFEVRKGSTPVDPIQFLDGA